MFNKHSVMLRLVLLLGLALLSCAHPLVSNLIDDDSDEQEQLMPSTPKWYNHCKAVFDSSHHLTDKLSEGTNLEIIRDLFQRVEKSARMSLLRAENVKQQIVGLEPDFNNAKGLRLESNFEWLPEIHPFSEEFFKDMTRDLALIYAHRYIEEFSVALEQMVVDHRSDRTTHYFEAIHSSHFEKIDQDNYNVLCEIRLAMSVVFGSVNQHFITRTERSIMPDEDRLIGDLSKRMVRDYRILRQYVKTTQYLIELFRYIRVYKLTSL